jgi:nucleoside-diphosphate-sugar epimerase
MMHLAREVMLANAYAGPLCLLRPTLIYGAADPHNGYGPNRFLRLAMDRKDIVLFGEGEERRDHVAVEDVAMIVARVLERRSAGTLNAATGQVASFRNIAEMVAAQVSPTVSVRSSPRKGPMPHRGYRPFDISAMSQAFPDFRYRSLADGLTQMRNELMLSPVGGTPQTTTGAQKRD